MVISQKLLNPGEEIIVSTRTHPKALLLPLLTLIVLLAVGVVAQVYIDLDNADTERILQLVVWAIIVVLVLQWWRGRKAVSRR